VVEDPDRSPDDTAAALSSQPEHGSVSGGSSLAPADTIDTTLVGEVEAETPAHIAAVDAPPEPVAEEIEEEEEEVEDDGPLVHAEPLEFIDEGTDDDNLNFEWFILKVAVNREDSIKEALLRRVRMNGLEKYFKEVVVPTEDVKEFTKTGKARVVKKKLYPGYILVNMHINDETWFIVRETSGIGDFTGAGGKPTPMLQKDVDRILKLSRPVEEGPGTTVKTTIPFKHGDRVRVKEGYFQNFEGDVDTIDEANGRVSVLVNIFGRSTPVELEHWQIELV